MNILLLSAGWGTRLRPLTFYRPKPLIPVRGQTLLERWQTILSRFFRVKRFFVNVHAMSPWFARFFEKKDLPNVHLIYEPRILGSGGSILYCASSLSDRWLMVINTDTFLDYTDMAWINQLVPKPNVVTMLVSSKTEFNNVVVDECGKIVRFRSHVLSREEQKQGYRIVAFAGIHLLDRKLLEPISWNGEFLDIIQIYASMAERKIIHTVECPSEAWHDIGAVKRYMNIHRRNTLGNIWLGRHCTINPRSFMENVVLWDGVRIISGSNLKSCIVTDGTRVSGVYKNAIITPSGIFPISRT